MKSRGRLSAENDTTVAVTELGVDGDDKEAKAQRSQLRGLKITLLFFLGLVCIGIVVSQNQKHYYHLAGDHSNRGFMAASTKIDLGPTEEELQRKVDVLDQKVRAHKKKPNMIMEADPEGLKLTKELQHITHQLLVKRYGRHTFRVRVDLEFPPVITAQDGKPAEDYILIELAPIDLIPCSVYNFLEIARTWKFGSFHRNAGHVLQVSAHSDVKQSMPFQEYSSEYPHKKGTTGYAGRPSGPAWYISIMDNSRNHGPGSQQKHNAYEADSLFGRVVRGFDDVVPRIHSTPQNGWLDDANKIQIPKMTILVPQHHNNDDNTDTHGIPHEKKWVPWMPSHDLLPHETS